MRKETLLLVAAIGFTSSSLYSLDYDTLISDVEKMTVEGSRPLSFGIEYALSTRGTLRTTTRDLDFAISGEGFFVVRDQETQTILLTRNGHFHVDSDGNIRNGDQYLVVASNSTLSPQRGELIDVRSVSADTIPPGIVYSDKTRNPFLILNPADFESVQSQDGLYFLTDRYSRATAVSIIRKSVELSPMSFTDISRVLNSLVKESSSELSAQKLPVVLFQITKVISYFTEEGFYSPTDLKELDRGMGQLQDLFFCVLIKIAKRKPES